MSTFIGIDPGVTNLGLAAIIDGGGVAVQKLSFPPGDNRAEFVMTDYIRCKELRTALYNWLAAIIQPTRPIRVGKQVINGPVITIEGPATIGHRRIQIGFLHQAIYDAVVGLGLGCVIVVAPMVLKKYVTGKGNAGKTVVMEGILRKWFRGDIPDFGSQDLYEAYALARIGAVISAGLAPKWMVGKTQAYRVYSGCVREVVL